MNRNWMNHTRMNRIGLWLLALSLQLSVAASNVFVGSINQTDALLALVLENGRMTAYSCGGPESWSSHTSWFNGSLQDGVFELTGQEGHRLSGQVLGSAARGQLTLADGRSFSWQASLALPDSAAGLYRLDETDAVTGFIVSNDLLSVGSIRLIRPNAVVTFPVEAATALPSRSSEALEVCVRGEERRCFRLPRFE